METLFAKKDPSLMLGKAFICFNKAKHRDHCYKNFKRTGFIYTHFGFGENTLQQFFIPVKNRAF